MIPRLGRFPGGGYGNPLQYSCLENPHGQRSLAGYSPWDPKESDPTERLSAAQCCICWGFPCGAVVKNPPAMWEMWIQSRSAKSPGGGNGNTIQYFSLEKSHEQRSILGYIPWAGKESDRSEHAHTYALYLLSLGLSHIYWFVDTILLLNHLHIPLLSSV